MRRLALATVTAFFALVASAHVSMARESVLHDNPPEVQQWFRDITDQEGHSCCGPADGYRQFDAVLGTVIFDDWEMRNKNEVWIHMRNPYDPSSPIEWHLVPPKSLIKKPGTNPTGVAIVWVTRGFSGTMIITCFAPGPEG